MKETKEKAQNNEQKLKNDSKNNINNTNKNDSNTKKSISNTSKSDSNTKKSVSNTSKTDSNTKKSVSNTSKSDSNTKKSVSNTSKSVSNTKKGVSNTVKTDSNTKKSVSNTSKADSNNKKDVSNTSKTDSNTKKSVTKSNKSISNTSKSDSNIEKSVTNKNLKSKKNVEESSQNSSTEKESVSTKNTKKDTNQNKKKTKKSKLENKSSDNVYINNDVTKLEERLINLKANSNENSSVEKNSNKSNKSSKIKDFICNIIILICTILIIYSSINIIIWYKNNIDNNKLIEKVTNDTPISETEQVKISESLEVEKKYYDLSHLKAQNADTVGWIHVNNTNIDYPVVKGTDNNFYLKHAFDKSYNAAGWIYADYRNRCDDTDKNLIIYGHNRLNNNMFGTLENVLTQEWLANESNHYINYSNFNTSHLYSIFSTFICTGNDSVNYLKTDFANNDEYIQYIQGIKNKSTYNFNTEVTENDHIITLYTCHGLNNERLIVCGKLIS